MSKIFEVAVDSQRLIYTVAAETEAEAFEKCKYGLYEDKLEFARIEDVDPDPYCAIIVDQGDRVIKIGLGMTIKEWRYHARVVTTIGGHTESTGSYGESPQQAIKSLWSHRKLAGIEVILDPVPDHTVSTRTTGEGRFKVTEWCTGEEVDMTAEKEELQRFYDSLQVIDGKRYLGC